MRYFHILTLKFACEQTGAFVAGVVGSVTLGSLVPDTSWIECDVLHIHQNSKHFLPEPMMLLIQVI